jgi:hypothetical protein
MSIIDNPAPLAIVYVYFLIYKHSDKAPFLSIHAISIGREYVLVAYIVNTNEGDG